MVFLKYCVDYIKTRVSLLNLSTSTFLFRSKLTQLVFTRYLQLNLYSNPDFITFLLATGVSLLHLPKMTEVFTCTACRQLSQMLLAIIFFHSSEYVLAISYHGKSNVTLSSLLISKHYTLAMIISLIEYVLEIILFPWLKEYWWISNLGFVIVVAGELIRKSAVITAGQAFTHLIKIHHEEDHKLVSHGVYKFFRHPGYCGFFIWSVGTQIMLCNPISSIGFAYVVWRFFAQRIPYEEYFLRRFFGSQYEEYAQQVPSGIPFVK